MDDKFIKVDLITHQKLFKLRKHLRSVLNDNINYGHLIGALTEVNKDDLSAKYFKYISGKAIFSIKSPKSLKEITQDTPLYEDSESFSIY